MKRFVIGDIHGRYQELKQVLGMCKFDYERDLLILLGDVIDRGPKSKEVVEELLKIKNLVFVMGNHDNNFMERCTISKLFWPETYKNYGVERFKDIPASHQAFFKRAILYHELDNMLFVHGSVDPVRGVHIHKSQILNSRRLADTDEEVIGYSKVFIGHTPTLCFDKAEPIKKHNVIMMDCGAGIDGGRLAVMDVDSEEYWVSDEVD